MSLHLCGCMKVCTIEKTQMYTGSPFQTSSSALLQKGAWSETAPFVAILTTFRESTAYSPQCPAAAVNREKGDTQCTRFRPRDPGSSLASIPDHPHLLQGNFSIISHLEGGNWKLEMLQLLPLPTVLHPSYAQSFLAATCGNKGNLAWLWHRSSAFRLGRNWGAYFFIRILTGGKINSYFKTCSHLCGLKF